MKILHNVRFQNILFEPLGRTRLAIFIWSLFIKHHDAKELKVEIIAHPLFRASVWADCEQGVQF